LDKGEIEENYREYFRNLADHEYTYFPLLL
jgi:hypothetical protein